MNSNEGSTTLLHKVDPIDSFWNHKQSNKNKNLKKWRLDEKRFTVPEVFTSNRRGNVSTTETYILGPGAGAGVGCGVGFGFGLAGGAGLSDGLWNHLSVVFGFGFGCGVGVGFGYGQGLGYGSSWKSIKTDVLGFKEKKDPHKRGFVHFL